MKKNALIAAVAAALAVPALAHADVTVYGKIRVASQYQDREYTLPYTYEPMIYDAWGMEDHSSRVGIKGFEELGGGLRAVYQMEFGVNVGEGLGKATWFAQRNSFVGLAGGFGTVLFGRHDTPLKLSTAKLDFFLDTNADNDDQASFSGLWTSRGAGLFDGRRVDGVIAYISPSMYGFTLMSAVAQTAVDDGIVGSNSKADEFAAASSTALTYSNGPFYGSVAYESISMENLGLGSYESYQKWRFGAGVLNYNNFSASFIYEDRSGGIAGAATPGLVADVGLDSGNPIGNDSGWQLSLAYDLGATRLKGMYGESGWDILGEGGEGGDGVELESTVWALGVEHRLSNRTDVQVIYRGKETEAVGYSETIDDNVFAVQFDHSF